MGARRGRAWLAALAIVWLAEPAIASAPPAGDYAGHPDALAIADELAREHGIDRARTLALLAEARRQPGILEAVSRPAERTRTWGEYRPLFVGEDRIAGGVAFWRAHAAALARAERQFGVPAEVVVAIIGVETRYGRQRGQWRVLDALATLAFDYPPRAPFFRRQLKEFVQLAGRPPIDPLAVRGSYAGAMGYPQFTPGSYRHYAVDFDGDGMIDLLDNPVDAIGSVARFLREHGWRPGEPAAARLTRSGDGADAVTNQGLAPRFTAGQVAAAGLAVARCRVAGFADDWCADPAADTPVTAWRLAGPRGDEYWLGLPNFEAVTRYNRSELYALAVLQLGREIRVRHRDQALSAPGGE